MLHQSEQVPVAYKYSSTAADESEHRVVLQSEALPGEGEALTWTFQPVSNHIFRTTFSSPQHPLPPYPSIKAKNILLGSEINTTFETEHRRVYISTPDVDANISYTGPPVVLVRLKGQPKATHADVERRSYVVDGTGIARYTRLLHPLHVGLGEKAAPMDLTGRSFLLSASDVLRYDSWRSDPLYKHIPWLVAAGPDGCVGTFSASLARAQWSVGSELDAIWGEYKVYRQSYGGLDEYLVVGKTIDEVLSHFSNHLVGRPLVPPKWSMGYIGGGMLYSMTDDPPAAESVLGFVRRCVEEGIPCSGFELSSGYTMSASAPHTRNVFQWNKTRFPDPKGFVEEMHSLGVRILANVKPWILCTHPEYHLLVQEGAFLKDPRSGEQAVEQIWSGADGESVHGSHLDFTSKAASEFWANGVKSLCSLGIDAIWNDNNHYNLPDDRWECALETIPVPDGIARRDIGLWGRAMQTQLHGQISFNAVQESNTHQRPYIVTRSATPGTVRTCAGTWGGDNICSWSDMEGGNALILNAGMSLMPWYGQDIGGFSGPLPTSAQLLRWCQMSVYSPRFCINSWKTGEKDKKLGAVTEPWMYPQVTPCVRRAVQRRYELVPYIYSMAVQASLHGAPPPMRWVGYGFEDDPMVWDTHRSMLKGTQQYWFGDAFLIGGVFSEAVDEVGLYLPVGPRTSHGFLDTNYSNGVKVMEAGQLITVCAPLEKNIAVLARVGSAVPIARPGTQAIDDDVWRGVEIFPPPVVEMPLQRSTWFEDDGISVPGNLCTVTVEYSADVEGITVFIAVSTAAEWKPKWCERGVVAVVLPAGESRSVRDGRGVEVARADGKCRAFEVAFKCS